MEPPEADPSSSPLLRGCLAREPALELCLPTLVSRCAVRPDGPRGLERPEEAQPPASQQQYPQDASLGQISP